VEGQLYFFLVDVQRGDGVVATRIVVEDIELSACYIGNAGVQFADRVVARELQGEVGDLRVRRGVFGGVANGCEDVEAWMASA
jgi:hypothetical protein